MAAADHVVAAPVAVAGRMTAALDRKPAVVADPMAAAAAQHMPPPVADHIPAAGVDYMPRVLAKGTIRVEIPCHPR